MDGRQLKQDVSVSAVKRHLQQACAAFRGMPLDLVALVQHDGIPFGFTVSRSSPYAVIVDDLDVIAKQRCISGIKLVHVPLPASHDRFRADDQGTSDLSALDEFKQTEQDRQGLTRA